MIRSYHRPDTIEGALELLARPRPRTLPLGGGTLLNAPSSEEFDVVDLQLLDLGKITKKGSLLQVGASTTLQALYDHPHIQAAVRDCIRLETNRNLRNVATVAGSLVAATGRSAFAAVCLAMDAALSLLPGDEKQHYGSLLPLRSESLPGRLITHIDLPLQAKLVFHYVARSPGDLPLVAVALAQWSSGRIRLVLGGFGPAPILALDGKDAPGLIPAVENAFSHAADEWASAEYRLDVARMLTQRALVDIGL